LPPWFLVGFLSVVLVALTRFSVSAFRLLRFSLCLVPAVVHLRLVLFLLFSHLPLVVAFWFLSPPPLALWVCFLLLLALALSLVLVLALGLPWLLPWGVVFVALCLPPLVFQVVGVFRLVAVAGFRLCLAVTSWGFSSSLARSRFQRSPHKILKLISLKA
jgi:hypothetical protein